MSFARVAFAAWIAIAIAIAIAGAIGCQPSAAADTPARIPPAPAPSAPTPTFSLSFGSRPVGVVYAYEKLSRAVDATDAGVALSFDASDIARFVVGDAPSESMCLVLTPRAREKLEKLPDTTPFVVRVGPTKLFVGVVYPKIGAAAIETPVLHVEPSGALLVGAHQGSAYGMPAAPEARDRIDRPELRAALAGVRSSPKDPKSPCE